jgi:hypothetical protein
VLMLFYTWVLCVALLAGDSISTAQAQTAAIAAESKSWYDKGYAKPVPTTLKAALAADKELSADSPHWKPKPGASGLREICAALNAVKLSCDYNTRYAISQFLTFYGKGLFPAAAGTNPYCTPEPEREGRLNDCFIGRPQQNEMLARAIRNNRHLFKDGDISAEAVRRDWK